MMRCQLAIMLIICVGSVYSQTPDTTKQVDQQHYSKMLIDIKRPLLTTYDTEGRPRFQSQIAKGFHRVEGEVTLSSGKANVTFNNSPLTGRQDVSFQDSSSYRGHAWSLDTTNTNTYRLYPVSGTRCIILSSDGADASTVRFVAEGD